MVLPFPKLITGKMVPGQVVEFTFCEGADHSRQDGLGAAGEWGGWGMPKAVTDDAG